MQNRSNMLSKIKETEEGIGRELERQKKRNNVKQQQIEQQSVNFPQPKPQFILNATRMRQNARERENY